MPGHLRNGDVWDSERRSDLNPARRQLGGAAAAEVDCGVAAVLPVLIDTESTARRSSLLLAFDLPRSLPRLGHGGKK
jgi:hypothetical protein